MQNLDASLGTETLRCPGLNEMILVPTVPSQQPDPIPRMTTRGQTLSTRTASQLPHLRPASDHRTQKKSALSWPHRLTFFVLHVLTQQSDSPPGPFASLEDFSCSSGGSGGSGGLCTRKVLWITRSGLSAKCSGHCSQLMHIRCHQILNIKSPGFLKYI